MDGTFDVILVPLGEAAVPVVYALMEKKTQACYEELLRAVTSKCASLGVTPDPEIVVTDFEKASMNAVKEVIGSEVKTQGCFFHMTQSTWRKVLGLSGRYREDEGFRVFVGMLDGLAFLPVEEVGDGLCFLKTVQPVDADELVRYFETYYVSGSFRSVSRRNGNVVLRRVAPQFPPHVGNGHRTNNYSEAWNRSFRSLVGHSHPSVHRLIAALRTDSAAVSTAFHQEAVGIRHKKRVKLTTVNLQRRLRNLCMQYVGQEKTLEQFLRGIGRTIRF
ncbi:uncharacterized protein LOC135378611 [Ornithodoros turicata]|uniref:uncharacterized protein LOC135378611 n=1 Tax=Ornithodoros turicata TaxID=34597 RepID=UPI00313985B3